jgi:glutaredoxin
MDIDSNAITVIGATWCPDCRRAKTFLAEQRIAYDWIDLEQHPEAIEVVERYNNGGHSIPTIIFPDGSHLTEPGNDQLADKLGLTRSAMCPSYDVIMVGGGPTNLTAAIYAARENQSVLIIEKSAPGGQAGVTERLDNYPGFPDGVGVKTHDLGIRDDGHFRVPGHLVLKQFAPAECLVVLDDGDVLGELGEEEALFEATVTSANDHNFLRPLEQWPVTGGTEVHARPN